MTEPPSLAAPADLGAAPALTPGGVLRIWAPHLLALLLPVGALAFLVTAPHRWWTALLLLVVPGAVVQVVDRFGGRQVREPRPDLPARPFDALLAVLVVVQLVNVGVLAVYFASHTLWALDSLVAILLVGASSGYSGIVVAHELIHRTSARARLAGRALLCTVLYEHFYTEHVRGHHVRVGTPEDPATARFGESFARFYVRTVPAQFRSAWRWRGDPRGG